MADGDVDTLNRVFRVTVKLGIRQQKIQTGFHLRDIGLPNQTAQDCHTHAEVWMNTILRPVLSSSMTIDRLECEEVRTKDYFAKDYTSVVGASTEPVSSTMLAVCVSLKSNSRLRHANGRMFLPLLNQPQADVINPSLLALYTTFASATANRYISGAITLDDWELVVLGSPLPTLDPANPQPYRWTRVKNIRVNPLVTALRSRKVGVGN